MHAVNDTKVASVHPRRSGSLGQRAGGDHCTNKAGSMKKARNAVAKGKMTNASDSSRVVEGSGGWLVYMYSERSLLDMLLWNAL